MKTIFAKFYSNKKIFFSVLIGIIVIGAVVTLAICLRHQHKFNDVIEPAKCEKAGNITRVCECGEREGNPSVIDPLGHKYENDICVRCKKSKAKFQITSLEFLQDGENISELTKDAYCDSFSVSVRINNGADLSAYAKPKITYEFVGESYGSTVSAEGVVDLGDFIGNVTLSVTVESENKLSATLPISSIQGEGLVIDYLSVSTKEGYTQTYAEGGIFDKDSITVWGENSNGLIRICDFDVDSTPLTLSTTEVAITYGDLITEMPVLVSRRTLEYIEVISPPNKTEYYDGQTFKKEGLVVMAYFDSLSEIVVDFYVDESSVLTLDDKFAVISYTYNGVTKTVKQDITVVPKKLLSISADTSKTKTFYTQGEVFDPSGLIVKAEFELFGKMEVEGYEYTKTPLSADFPTVVISYSVGEETKTLEIPVNVIKPYTEFYTLYVTSPEDVSVNWLYSYMTDDGKTVVDNTAYDTNGYEYDEVNGIYEIPVGATVTLTVTNPSITSVEINGSSLLFDYSAKTVTLVMGREDITFTTVEMSGNFILLSFVGEENRESFIYGITWDGIMKDEDLKKLSAIFADTDKIYYTYKVGEDLLRFEDLKNTVLNSNLEIEVIKNQIPENTREVTLYVDSELFHIATLNMNSQIQDLPVFTKQGYAFDGWALTKDGNKITDQVLSEYLTREQSTYKLYVRWIKETVDYSQKYISAVDGNAVIIENSSDGIKFTGLWKMTDTNGKDTVELNVNFEDDGTFTYEFIYNGVTNCIYSGEYRLSDNSISLILIETEMEIVLVSEGDFAFGIGENVILANMIYLGEDSVILSQCELTKSN